MLDTAIDNWEEKMRTPVIAGNWKMNKGPKEAAILIQELKLLVKDAQATVVVCVPAVDFQAAKQTLSGSRIKLGAQNVHYQESGAFTGEVSAAMLREAGVEYVIIGHSERRQYFGETDETVNLRVKAAVKGGLIPIICVGENKGQREANYTDALVTCQTLIALTGLTENEVKKVIIAYEPVWAIGTGLTATDEQANETIGVIREAIRRKYGKRIGNSVRIQYGGSMNPKNVKGLMAQPEIDGGLIGGASLKAADFAGVVNFDK
jgi:triosephosphate isomerase